MLQRMLLLGHGAAPDHDEAGGAAAVAAAAATAAASAAAGEAAAPSAVEYFKASQKQGGGGAAAVAAPGEDAAAAALLRTRTPKELGRGCDYILAVLLLSAPPALAARWARPFGWHGLGERAFRSLGEEKAPPKPAANKTKPGHRGEFAAPKGRIVAELNGEPRPKGRAPGNDTGTPLVWSYVRGKWMDVSKGGAYRGVKLSEAEREVVLAENVDFNRKMAALEEKIFEEWRQREASGEATEGTVAAAAAAQAADAAAAVAAASGEEKLDEATMRALKALEHKTKPVPEAVAWLTEQALILTN